MRAVTVSDFGRPVELVDLPIPEPSAGEVRVRVHAASVNGFDLAVANGFLKDAMEHRFPVVLGKDFAGVVDAVGDGVEGFREGDRVFGVVTKPFVGDGSFAEFVTVSTAVGLAVLPETIDFELGAALGLAGSAALAALDAADIKPGETVLITGATGGVGTLAVQLARRAGATVIATAGDGAAAELVTSLGATAVDFHGDVTATVLTDHAPDGVDAVLHFAGDPAALLPAVRSGGRLVSTLIWAPEHQLPSSDVAVVGIVANPDPATLSRVATNQTDGSTRTVVQRTYSLEETASAMADFGGGTLGKRSSRWSTEERVGWRRGRLPRRGPAPVDHSHGVRCRVFPYV